MIDFLKSQWFFLGLKAPWFSWVAALFLLLYPAYELIRLLIIYRRLTRDVKSAKTFLLKIKKDYPSKQGEGFPLPGIDKIRTHFSKVYSLNSIWTVYERCLIYRKGEGNIQDNVYSTESAGHCFTEEAFLESNLNKRFFLAIPGIVTGTGLLFTFLAILVALIDVRLNEVSKQVVGLEGLIGGLSGKFVSSVAALLSATIFLGGEKAIFHRLNNHRKSLITMIDNVLPRITPVQVLLEIQRDTSGQSDAFRMFSADLAVQLKNSFDQSMSPIMERMVTAVDDLNQFMRSSKNEMITALNQMNALLKEAEHSKQDTIAGRLEQLLNAVEKAISASLSKMGQDFKESLSDNTREEFSKIAEALGGTRTILDKMNDQMGRSQQAFEELLTLSRENFERQVSSGEAQIASLAGVLNKLSADMKKTIEDTSLKSSDSAKGVISEVSSLSAKNTESLKRLLEKHESELNRVEELNALLQSTLANFNNSIKLYSQVTSEIKQVSSDIKGTVTMMTGVSNVMKEGQEAIRQVASLAQTQIKSLGDENLKQRETWQIIHKSMEEYESLFKRIEVNSKSMLNEVSRGLESYNAAAHKGFDNILSTANDTIGNAVQRLAGSINDLESFLEELSEEISKFNGGRDERK